MSRHELSKLGKGTREELTLAVHERLEDARVLQAGGRPASAIASAIYAIEIQLKIVIIHRLDVTHLPEIFQTHNFPSLLMHAGLRSKIKRTPKRDISKNWDEILAESEKISYYRYSFIKEWDTDKAERVLSQTNDPSSGVIPWLKKQSSSRPR